MLWLDPILRPLARLAVRKGWLFPVLEHRLRRAYIAAADSLEDGEATDSRVSVLTGLQRRDIARLRREPNPSQIQRQPLAEIIALWSDDPAYDPNGLPIKGNDPSFTSLAHRVRKDVHPRTFLDVLIENEAVEEMGDIVVLKTRSYRPLSGSEDQLAYLVDNVADHLTTSVANVVDDAAKYDMAVHYKGLSAAAIDQLDKHFRSRMKQTLQELDTMARALPATEDGPHRFRAGAYFFDDLESKARPNDP